MIGVILAEKMAENNIPTHIEKDEFGWYFVIDSDDVLIATYLQDLHTEEVRERKHWSLSAEFESWLRKNTILKAGRRMKELTKNTENGVMIGPFTEEEIAYIKLRWA